MWGVAPSTCCGLGLLSLFHLSTGANFVLDIVSSYGQNQNGDFLLGVGADCNSIDKVGVFTAGDFQKKSPFWFSP